MTFGKDKLKIKSIDAAVISENHIGLFVFKYDRPPNAEIIVPVLKFENTYFLYKNDQNYVDSVYKAFESSYAQLFDAQQLSEMKRRFSSGIIFSGHRISY